MSNHCNIESTKCVDVPGSYQCICKTGFQRVSEFECLDIDECLSRPCGNHQTCVNTLGSFHCSCEKNYVLAKQTSLQEKNYYEMEDLDNNCVLKNVSMLCKEDEIYSIREDGCMKHKQMLVSLTFTDLTFITQLENQTSISL